MSWRNQVLRYMYFFVVITVTVLLTEMLFNKQHPQPANFGILKMGRK